MERNKENEIRMHNVKGLELDSEDLGRMAKDREGHLARREAIGRTIESKQRELEFLKDLTPNDVIYMMQKKQHYAAKKI